jgi:hypothetical protein
LVKHLQCDFVVCHCEFKITLSGFVEVIGVEQKIINGSSWSDASCLVSLKHAMLRVGYICVQMPNHIHSSVNAESAQ